MTFSMRKSREIGVPECTTGEITATRQIVLSSRTRPQHIDRSRRSISKFPVKRAVSDRCLSGYFREDVLGECGVGHTPPFVVVTGHERLHQIEIGNDRQVLAAISARA